MKRLSESLKESAKVEACGAFPETLLNACAVRAIEFWDMECVDSYTLRFCVYDERYKELEEEARRCMCEIRVISRAGGKTALRLLLRRRWLVICALLAAAAIVLSSLFIWDFEIFGNNKLSRARVLRALEECGVSYGTFLPSLSTDLVRNKMLQILPELAWMSVNVNGSRAEVLIAERQEKPEIYAQSQAADIVAKRDGIISKLFVLNGKTMVSVGQSVTEGDTLVSGEMDSLTGDIRYVRSLAEVQADTWYEVHSVSPLEVEVKYEILKCRNRYALQIGQTRINIYFKGRNPVDGCDKIVHNYKVGIKGLFTLPLSLVREEYIYYKLRSVQYSDEDNMFARMHAQLSDNIDGTVLEHSFSSFQTSDVLYASMRAHCIENIALTRESQP